MASNPRITKSHLICYAVVRLTLETGQAPTRLETMRYVHQLERKGWPFMPGSNVSYFAPPPAEVGRRTYPSDYSVLARGLVAQAGRRPARGRPMTYAVTAAGMQAAQAYVLSRAIPAPQ